VSELETKLADDWKNADVLAAHATEREELRNLLALWERLFEAAQRSSDV
jgi:hypothetical protein